MRAWLFAAFVSVALPVLGGGQTVNETKTRLQALERQISSLTQTLNTTKGQRQHLNTELAATDRQIAASLSRLKALERESATRAARIDALRKSIAQQSSRLEAHLQLVRAHVKARHRLSPSQPLKWLLNAEDPGRFARLMSYYHHLLKAREQSIEATRAARTRLQAQEKDLTDALRLQQAQRNEMEHRRKVLELERQKRQVVLAALEKDIAAKGSKLQEFQKNRENLSRLLTELSRQSSQRPATGKPLLVMHGKLPLPVKVARSAMVNTYQGVTLFAAEGQPVTAVSSGKVVFSDWLNGYGMLIIIDHGHGFMTLYGHNKLLYRHRGEQVRTGDTIAAVGHTGGLPKNGLYFEVRKYGKAIPPLKWLS